MEAGGLGAKTIFEGSLCLSFTGLLDGSGWMIVEAKWGGGHQSVEITD